MAFQILPTRTKPLSIQRFDRRPQFSNPRLETLSRVSCSHRKWQWHPVQKPPRQTLLPTLDGFPHRGCGGGEGVGASSKPAEAWESARSAPTSAKLSFQSLPFLTIRFLMFCPLSLPIWFEKSVGQTDEKGWRGQGGCSDPEKWSFEDTGVRTLKRGHTVLLHPSLTRNILIEERDKPCRRRSRWSLVRERSPIRWRWGWHWCCWGSIPSCFLGKARLTCQHDVLVSEIQIFAGLKSKNIKWGNLSTFCCLEKSRIAASSTSSRYKPRHLVAAIKVNIRKGN